ncbi:hypothetical protein [Trueperella pyogenes]|uniref:hypothetical protein n=1 Tax=Trueperella pyogenes TaxID=1661 RepID=UPI00345DFD2F
MSTRTFAGIAAAALVVSASGTAVANAAPATEGDQPKCISIKDKETQVAAAKAALEAAKTRLAATEAKLPELQKALADAQAKLADAVKADLGAGNKVAAAEKAVASAKEALTQAKAAYDKAVAAEKAAQELYDKYMKVLALEAKGKTAETNFQKADAAKKAADEAYIKYRAAEDAEIAVNETNDKYQKALAAEKAAKEAYDAYMAYVNEADSLAKTVENAQAKYDTALKLETAVQESRDKYEKFKAAWSAFHAAKGEYEKLWQNYELTGDALAARRAEVYKLQKAAEALGSEGQEGQLFAALSDAEAKLRSNWQGHSWDLRKELDVAKAAKAKFPARNDLYEKMKETNAASIKAGDSDVLLKELARLAKISNAAGDSEDLEKEFDDLKKLSDLAGDPDKFFGELKAINEELRQLGGKTSEELSSMLREANGASIEAGDANVLADSVEKAKKALAKAEEDLGPTKAERAEVALKLEAARNAADDAARELTDLEKAISGAKSDFEAKRVAYEVASGLKECAPIVPPAPVEPTPAPQPEPAPAPQPEPAPAPQPEPAPAPQPEPAPVPSDKVIAQKPAEGKKLAHTGATTDSSIAVAMASILGGLGLVAAARHTPRHRRGL